MDASRRLSITLRVFPGGGFHRVTTAEGVAADVTGHRSNALDNQCGATITDSSASGASLPLCERAEEVKH
uniref:Uncharacterized protein n=1 Tax=Hyaloperonospora arabidopsidis (strain Emoy2) TaxID=559515 RepID=M4BHV1_HYAAE